LEVVRTAVWDMATAMTFHRHVSPQLTSSLSFWRCTSQQLYS